MNDFFDELFKWLETQEENNLDESTEYSCFEEISKEDAFIWCSECFEETIEKANSAINDAKKISKQDLYLEMKKYFGSIIDETLGTGIKKLAPSEKNNYLRTNRSLRFLNDIPQGTKITKNDIGILRTEKILEVGLHPKFYDDFIGKTVTKDIKSGDAVLWSCIIES